MAHTPEWLDRRFILVMGKGGVGKTVIAEACARHLAAQGKRVYLAHILQTDEKQDTNLVQCAPRLFEQTLSLDQCFKEYIGMKLKMPALTSIFLNNRLIQYFQKAAPGVREIILLGKVWYEQNNYDHVVVDMPSTGYGLAMVRAPYNFSRLFPGGPIYRDALDMLTALQDSKNTAFVTVTLAEEMPLQESFDLAEQLREFVPDNKPWLVVNRLIEVEPKLKKMWKEHGAETSGLIEKDALFRALDYRVQRHMQQAEKLKRFTKENENMFHPEHYVCEGEDLKQGFGGKRK